MRYYFYMIDECIKATTVYGALFLPFSYRLFDCYTLRSAFKITYLLVAYTGRQAASFQRVEKEGYELREDLR